MTRLPRLLNKTLLVLFLSAAANSSLADEDVTKRLESARITLQQAIVIAEKETGGVAFEAELEKDSFNPEYEVELIANGLEYEVSIDAITSEVIKVRSKKND